jgi:hypothetical protein
MMYALHIALISLFLWVVGARQRDRWIFFCGALVKICAGISLGHIFMNYYNGGDTFLYFLEAKSLISGSFSEWISFLKTPDVTKFSGQPRAELFAKMVSVVAQLTQGDYWITSMYFSMFSFLAYWYFYCQTVSIFPQLKWPVALAFLFFPSTVFWSSGILKGAIIYPSIVWLAGITMKLLYRKNIYWSEYIVSICCALMIYFLAYYLFIILVPVLLFLLVDNHARRLGLPVWVRGASYISVLALAFFLAPQINPNLKPEKLPMAIYRNQVDVYVMAEAASAIDLNIKPTWGSLLVQVPEALMAGLYGPLPWHSGSAWSWIPKLENCLLLMLSILSAYLVFRQRLWEPDVLVIALLIYILFLAMVLPLAAPNFGSLSRYKACYTPFLVLLVSILPYLQWLDRRA